MSQTGIQLIVGLGNPGAEYENTRHNVGASVVLELAALARLALRYVVKMQGLHQVARWDGKECHLFIPTTFMNHSGQAVQAVANYYKIAPQSILIVHDEIDLPVGDIRLKFDGGDGGHNGLKDIIRHLNTKKFYRLRIGVGRPSHGSDVVDYVLKPPKKAERDAIETALADVYPTIPLLLEGQYQKVMQMLHSP